jgi:orotate phosphoribosyltransferase
MTKDDLLSEYVRCGIFQFGNIQLPDGNYAPIAFHFSLLPSFPALLKATAENLAPFVPLQNDRDRLLTTWDTIALGAVVSTITGMPMLWPRGELKSFTPAFSIEGTADVGNPTVLLTDVLLDAGPELEVMNRSKRTGLPVRRVLCVVETQQGVGKMLQQAMASVQIESLFKLSEVTNWLHTNQHITAHLANAIRKWESG